MNGDTVPSKPPNDLAASMYSTLYRALAATAKDQLSDIYLTVEPYGRALDPAEYKDPWSLVTRDGNPKAAKAVSDLVDTCHATDPTTRPNDHKVSDVYEEVLKANVSTPTDGEKQEEKKKMLDLQREIYVFDGDTNTYVHTPGYLQYKKALRAYRRALMRRQNAIDQNLPEEKINELTADADDAKADMDDAGGAHFESVEADLQHVGRDVVGLMFQDAQTRHDDGRYSPKTGGGEKFLVSSVSPDNWYDDGAADEWTTLTIAQGIKESQKSEESAKFAADFGELFWHVNADGSYEHRQMSSETTDVKISFKVCRCEIDRPWMNTLLLGLPGWHFSQGGIVVSDGKRRQEGTQMPLLSTEFVVVRDVSITANWSREDSSYLKTHVEGGGGIGIGPFRIGGGSGSSDTENSWSKAQYQNSTLTQKGLQLLGWVHTVVPRCPQDQPVA